MKPNADTDLEVIDTGGRVWSVPSGGTAGTLHISSPLTNATYEPIAELVLDDSAEVGAQSVHLGDATGWGIFRGDLRHGTATVLVTQLAGFGLASVHGDVYWGANASGNGQLWVLPAGAITPHEVAEFADIVGAIASNSSYVFVASGASLYSVKIADGTTKVVSTGVTALETAIAASDDEVDVASNLGGILHIHLSPAGDVVGMVHQLSQYGLAEAIALSSQCVYVSIEDTANNPGPIVVIKEPRSF